MSISSGKRRAEKPKAQAKRPPARTRMRVGARAGARAGARIKAPKPAAAQSKAALIGVATRASSKPEVPVTSRVKIPGSRAKQSPVPGETNSPAPFYRQLSRRTLVSLFFLLVLLGAELLVAGSLGLGPSWSGEAGATIIAATFSWALAARTSGRPILFGLLSFALGLAAVVLDYNWLRAGAAVMTSAVTAVLAVMATVPARTFLHAIRECLVVLVVALVGGFAVLGFEPFISLPRFQVVATAVALVMVFALVFRLGSGFHGMGRRGLALVAVGAVVLALVLVYGAVLQRYGSPAVVDRVFDAIAWVRETLGATPRPVEALVGIPAILWGTHMRARRGQGWWVCAFGVGVSIPIIYALLRTSNWDEFLIAQGYSLLIGVILGFALIHLDLAMTGTRGSRSLREEEERALRPEPTRTFPLLVSPVAA
jgi:hypothetical protein